LSLRHKRQQRSKAAQLRQPRPRKPDHPRWGKSQKCPTQAFFFNWIQLFERCFDIGNLVRVRRIPYLTDTDVRCRRGDEADRMRPAKSGRRSRAWLCAG
jgi:hypothetical protein